MRFERGLHHISLLAWYNNYMSCIELHRGDLCHFHLLSIKNITGFVTCSSIRAVRARVCVRACVRACVCVCVCVCVVVGDGGGSCGFGHKITLHSLILHPPSAYSQEFTHPPLPIQKSVYRPGNSPKAQNVVMNKYENTQNEIFMS